MFQQASVIATSEGIPLWGTLSVGDRKVCPVGVCGNPGVECSVINSCGKISTRSTLKRNPGENGRKIFDQWYDVTPGHPHVIEL